MSVRTDDFGDFWVDGLNPDKYQIEITKTGYKNISMIVDITDKDVNLGDIEVQAE